MYMIPRLVLLNKVTWYGNKMRTYTPMNSAKLHPVFVGPCVVVKVHSVVVKVHSEHVIAMQLDARGFREIVNHKI